MKVRKRPCRIGQRSTKHTKNLAERCFRTSPSPPRVQESPSCVRTRKTRKTQFCGLLPSAPQSLEAKMEVGFGSEACERKGVCEELTKMKEEVTSLKLGGSCAVSSAASTLHGLGSGTFAGPPTFGPNRKENWAARKMDIKGMVKDWPMREMTGLNDEQATEFQNTWPKELKDVVDQTKRRLGSSWGERGRGRYTALSTPN